VWEVGGWGAFDKSAILSGMTMVFLQELTYYFLTAEKVTDYISPTARNYCSRA